MTSIFITGQNGYLGKCVVNEVILNSRKINFCSGHLEDLATKSIKTDLLIHMAAALRHNDKQTIINTNIKGTSTLLSALRSKPKVIFVSSRAVYGINEGLQYCSENSQTINLDDYGKSKQEAENIIINSGLEYLIFRSSILYGVGVNNIGKNFINQMIKDGFARGEINVINKSQLVDPLYVWDLAKVIKLCLKGDIPWGNIYNISGECITVYSIATVIAREISRRIGKETSIRIGNHPKNGVLLNSTKLKKTIGLNYNANIENVISKLIEHIKPHEKK